MQNNYNRQSPHNKTQNHSRVKENELNVLLSLIENNVHRQFAKLYYGEGYTLEKCADLLFYSKRQIERIKVEVDRIVFYSLLKMVANSKNDLKLLQIKKIITE